MHRMNTEPRQPNALKVQKQEKRKLRMLIVLFDLVSNELN